MYGKTRENAFLPRIGREKKLQRNHSSTPSPIKSNGPSNKLETTIFHADTITAMDTQLHRNFQIFELHGELWILKHIEKIKISSTIAQMEKKLCTSS